MARTRQAKPRPVDRSLDPHVLPGCHGQAVPLTAYRQADDRADGEVQDRAYDQAHQPDTSA